MWVPAGQRRSPTHRTPSITNTTCGLKWPWRRTIMPGSYRGVERQVLRIGREREPLLPHRGLGAVGVALPLHLLPGDIGVVEVTEHRGRRGRDGLRICVGRHWVRSCPDRGCRWRPSVPVESGAMTDPNPDPRSGVDWTDQPTRGRRRASPRRSSSTRRTWSPTVSMRSIDWFWDDERAVRYGIDECHVGHAAIAEYRRSQAVATPPRRCATR